MSTMRRIRLPGLLGLISAALTACGGGGGSSGDTGSLTLNLTDAPVSLVGLERVVVTFTGVTIQAADGQRSTYPVFDPVTGAPSRSLDLLALSGGKSVVLLDQELAAGRYSWMRLDVDQAPDETYVQVNGQRSPLRCPSCAQTGLKLNRAFTIDPAGPAAFTIDFDVRSSLTDPQSGNAYKLRPTLRIVETALAGNISGRVDSTLLSDLGGPHDCAVYVYEEAASPDDIYRPENGDPGGHVNPVATATVAFDADAYRYTVAYLPGGAYRAALTCEAGLDDPIQDDDITFHHRATVRVTEGHTTTHDFGP